METWWTFVDNETKFLRLVDLVVVGRDNEQEGKEERIKQKKDEKGERKGLDVARIVERGKHEGKRTVGKRKREGERDS